MKLAEREEAELTANKSTFNATKFKRRC
jgi:hypothetical protein